MAVIDTPDDVTLVAPGPNGTKSGSTQVVGQPGVRTYYYWVIVNYPIGSSVSGPFPVRNAPNLLNATNYVAIFWEPAPKAVRYDLLRTDTVDFPSQAGNYAVATGIITGAYWTDQGASLLFYDLAGLRFGAPVECRIYLNNRDYSRPTLEMPCQMSVTVLIFPDGSTQNTAASQTPWRSDIDAAGYQLHNLGGQLVVNGGIDAGAESFFNVANVSNSLYVESATSNYPLNVTGDVNITGVYRVNGVPISTGGASQTPWLSDINGADFNLSNVNSVTINSPSIDTKNNLSILSQPNDAFIPPNLGAISITDGVKANLQIGLFQHGPSVVGSWIQSGDTSQPSDAPLVLQPVSGMVGIGNYAPAYSLDVKGDVNITGVYRVNGAPLSTGASQTPWTTNIDGGGFNLSNTSRISVGTATGASNRVYPGSQNWYNNNSFRWIMYFTGTESGSNSGSNFLIQAGDDTGSFLGSGYLFINRATGNVGIGTTTPGSRLSVVGLPTSAAGLSPGDVWNNGGVLNIV